MVNDRRDSPLSERYLLLLDPDPGTAEAKYLDLFAKLVKFFEWRGAHHADDLAQETLRRGFGKIAQGTDVYADDPTVYFFGIARNVLRENWKSKARAFDQSDDLDARESGDAGAARTEAVILLEQCLQLIGHEDRDVLVRYHSGDRDGLLSELKVDANNLRVRVHRILQRLRRRMEEGLVTVK